jgi:hypothetical protein
VHRTNYSVGKQNNPGCIGTTAKNVPGSPIAATDPHFLDIDLVNAQAQEKLAGKQDQIANRLVTRRADDSR